MCFKVNEQCPGCGVRTGVVYYHKGDNCPNDPMTCNVNVVKDLRATGSRFLDLRCRTSGCLFSHTERERNEAQFNSLGPRVIIVTPGGTIRLDEDEVADEEVMTAASILTGSANQGAEGEAAGPVQVHPAYQSVTQYERDEQGRPIRRPLGRTRLPNGRMPLPDSRPPLASLRVEDSGLPSREMATSSRFAPSGPNPQRNDATGAGGVPLAPIPLYPAGARPTARAKGKAKATGEPASTPEAESAAGSPNGNTNNSRQGWSGHRLPEIPGRNGMTAVLVHKATSDRPPKWQYRSVGRLRLEDLPAEQAEQIRRLKARMDERVTWQTGVPGMGGGALRRPGGNAQGPRYLLEEDQLLQLLRLSGFGYEQIQREFIPRRSQDSLTVRRKGHKRGIHVRGFEYIPDNGFMSATSETDLGESDEAPGQQEGGPSVETVQQIGTGEDEAVGQREGDNNAEDPQQEVDAQEGNVDDAAHDADDEREADDGNDAHGGDEHEADNGNDADDECEADDGDHDSDTNDRLAIAAMSWSESSSNDSSDSEEDDHSEDPSDYSDASDASNVSHGSGGSDADNEEDSDDGDDSDVDMEDAADDANATMPANDNNGDTSPMDVDTEQEAPVQEQAAAPAPTSRLRGIRYLQRIYPSRIFRQAGTANAATTANAVSTAEMGNAESSAGTVPAESTMDEANTEGTATAVDTSPESGRKRKRDVDDEEDSDDDVPSKAPKLDED